MAGVVVGEPTMRWWLLLLCLGCTNPPVFEIHSMQPILSTASSHAEEWQRLCRDAPYQKGTLISGDVLTALSRIGCCGGIIRVQPVNDACTWWQANFEEQQ